MEIEFCLWDHIDDLRSTLTKIFGVIALGFVFALFFHTSLMHLIIPPSNQELITNHDIFEPQLVILSPIEGMMITLKVCFWASLTATAPFWLFILMKFISPGLKDSEKRLIVPFLFFSYGFMLLGVLMAYYFTIPIANHYFSLFNSELGHNLWSLSHYIEYTFVLLMGHAVAFEICFILLFLVHCNIISADWMISKRRFMIVLAFIVGAILTPPDVLTQCMLAFPLIGIYEIAILYAKRRGKVI